MSCKRESGRDIERERESMWGEETCNSTVQYVHRELKDRPRCRLQFV